MYALQVPSLVKGRFQRVTNGKPIDIYLPAVSVPLSGDDCFLVGKVRNPSNPQNPCLLKKCSDSFLEKKYQYKKRSAFKILQK